MKRALAIDEKALGPEHPTVGRDLSKHISLTKYFLQMHAVGQNTTPIRPPIAAVCRCPQIGMTSSAEVSSKNYRATLTPPSGVRKRDVITDGIWHRCFC
jgi:hypothetical protein